MKSNRVMKMGLVRDLMVTGILLTLLAVFQGQAQAEMIRGEVIDVAEDGSYFRFKNSYPSSLSTAEPFDIAVLPTTKFEKISSLTELRAGDEVAVDAAIMKESGVWEANAVRIMKVRLFQDVLTSEAPLK